MTDNEHKPEDSIPFFPDHVRTEFYVVLGVLTVALIIGIVALFKPVGLGDPADPLNTPLHVKPEWYFLALYQILKKIPPMILGIQGKIIGVALPILLVGLILVWPFIDHKPDKFRSIYRYRMLFVILVTLIIIGLTVWGEVS
jgi:quinol-cytochrome oxidoreductase complex cytochrome b subunit